MAQIFEHGYALIAGVDENQVSAWALPDVRKDVDALAQVFVHPARCGYLPEHVLTLCGPAATRQGILQGFAWLQAQLAADTSGNATAVVFYSGHGWRDAPASAPAGALAVSPSEAADYYFIPFDVERARLRTTALPASEMIAAIDGLAARRLLVLVDCCHAGGMGIKELMDLPASFTVAPPPLPFLAAPPEGARLAEPAAKEAAEDSAVLARGAGRAVLVSCASDQKSYIRSDRAMSIFTYHLVEGLTGHAQPAGGAPEVLVSDLVSYVHRRTPVSAAQQHGALQQPGASLNGNFAVALLLGGSGIKEGAAAPDPLAVLPPVSQTIVHGDQFTVGNISNSVVAIGRGARAGAP